jgi:segregation and condensation protein B
MLKAKIEAVLFLTDKPMKAQVIARTINEDVNVVRQALLELIHDYEERKGGLELADDNGYIIQVKDEYSSLINEFAPLEVPLALLRTLSAIAIKQPVQQSEIIKIRGAGAYDHIRELITRELIIKKDADEGRSPLLSTTKKFQEYFRLSGDGKSLRTELRKKDKTEEVQPGIADAQAIQLQLDEAINIQTDGIQVPAASAGEEPISFAPEAEDVAAATTATETVDKLKQIFDASPDNNLVFQPDAKVPDDSSNETVVPPSPPTTESANN